MEGMRMGGQKKSRNKKKYKKTKENKGDRINKKKSWEDESA